MRVRESLRGASPVLASQIADAIWPNHSMNRQGAALAASRFADRMKNDGILRYVVREHTRGWVLTHNVQIEGQPAFGLSLSNAGLGSVKGEK